MSVATSSTLSSGATRLKSVLITLAHRRRGRLLELLARSGVPRRGNTMSAPRKLRSSSGAWRCASDTRRSSSRSSPTILPPASTTGAAPIPRSASSRRPRRATGRDAASRRRSSSPRSRGCSLGIGLHLVVDGVSSRERTSRSRRRGHRDERRRDRASAPPRAGRPRPAVDPRRRRPRPRTLGSPRARSAPMIPESTSPVPAVGQPGAARRC